MRIEATIELYSVDFGVSHSTIECQLVRDVIGLPGSLCGDVPAPGQSVGKD